MTITETISAVKYFNGYFVSTAGFVYSQWRRGSSELTEKLRPLKGRVVRGGYLQVALYREGVPTFRYVHDLVLEAFVGPRPDGMEARHFPDRDKTNNQLSNLSWGSSKVNAADRVTHGTVNRGSRNGKVRLTAEIVREIRKSTETFSVLAKRYGVAKSTIGGVKSKATWRWLDDNH